MARAIVDAAAARLGWIRWLGSERCGCVTAASPYSCGVLRLPACLPAAPVSLNIYFHDMPTITFSTTGVNVTAPIAIGWMVPDGSGALVNPFTLVATTSLSASLKIGALRCCRVCS